MFGITLRARKTANAAILEVEDTRIGISEEVQPDIIRAFKQEPEGLSREYEGVGLGLSIVRRLVDALGGGLQLRRKKEKEAALGHGSRGWTRAETRNSEL